MTMTEMTAFRTTQERRRRRHCLTVLFDHSLVQAFPFLNDTSSQLVHSLDFPAVNLLLKDIPYFIIVNQQHHDNPVNEPSFTNLLTNIGGSFFMKHGVCIYISLHNYSVCVPACMFYV